VAGASDIRIVGVSDAVYYAPQVIADELGFFRDEGLNVTYSTGSRRGGVLEALAAGNADFILGGLWRPVLYAPLGVELIAFAELVQQCDFLLLGRSPREDVNWSSLNGGRLLVTTVGAPSPWLLLDELLRRRGVDLNQLLIMPGFPADEARDLFERGFADLIEIADLAAAPLLHNGAHQVALWREDVGALPWSVYYTNRDLLSRFHTQAVSLTRAIARAQKWIAERNEEDLTDALKRRFVETPSHELRALVRAYVYQQYWPSSPVVEQDQVARLLSILSRAAPVGNVVVEDVVDETIAAEAVQS
jgi:NitT/TauT family transport system substrate-binding protein